MAQVTVLFDYDMSLYAVGSTVEGSFDIDPPGKEEEAPTDGSVAEAPPSAATMETADAPNPDEPPQRRSAKRRRDTEGLGLCRALKKGGGWNGKGRGEPCGFPAKAGCGGFCGKHDTPDKRAGVVSEAEMAGMAIRTLGSAETAEAAGTAGTAEVLEAAEAAGTAGTAEVLEAAEGAGTAGTAEVLEAAEAAEAIETTETAEMAETAETLDSAGAVSMDVESTSCQVPLPTAPAPRVQFSA